MYKYKPRGIINKSGTHCWRNSLLQIIFNCPSLIRQFLYRPTTELGEKIKDIYKNKYLKLDNNIILFDDINNHQCAVEYFEYILNNSFLPNKFPKEMITNHEYKLYQKCNNSIKTKQETNNIIHWDGKDELEKFIVCSLSVEYCQEHETFEKVCKHLYCLRSLIVVSNINRSKNIPDEMTFKTNKYKVISSVLYNGTGTFGHYICWLNKICFKDTETNYLVDDNFVNSTDKTYMDIGSFTPVLLFYSLYEKK